MACCMIVPLAADASVEDFINARAFFATSAAKLTKRHRVTESWPVISKDLQHQRVLGLVVRS